MKFAPLIAVILVLFLALPAAKGARGKRPKPKPKPPKPPTPAKTCLGKDGQDYEIGEGYLDTKTCIQYTCAKKKGKLKMTGKKMPKPCTNNVCEVGWTFLGTGCYKFSPEGTHHEASAYCENEGGFLIEIDDQEEQDAAFQFYKDQEISGHYIWLGATDVAKEGEWIWSHSGKKMTFSAWYNGEPNGGTGENCLEARGFYDFTWNDQSCDDHNVRGLCEYNHKPNIPYCGCGKEIAALQVLIDDLQTTSNKNEMDIKTIMNAIETNKAGIASNEDAITVNQNSISTNKDDLATHEDAIHLNNETCSDVKTTAKHLGTCLADVNSPDCPPSGIGKTSIAEAIMENKEDIDGCCGGLMLNPVVLLTGGNGPNNSVEVFGIGKNRHCSKNLEDLPDRRLDHTMHFFNGKIILCGSQNNGETCLFLNENQIFVHHSQLKDYRYYHVGAVVNDKILILGGLNNPLQMQFWNGLQWEYSEHFNELGEFETHSCMAAISEDTVLMAGGSSERGSKLTNKMLKYKDGKWERMEDYPGEPRNRHGCAFIQTPEGDAFLMAGGWPSSFQEAVLYNIEKRTWEEVGKLANGRRGGKILNVGGRIIMVGGSSGVVEVEEYNVYTKTWSTIPEKLKEGRGQFDAVVVPGALVGC